MRVARRADGHPHAPRGHAHAEPVAHGDHAHDGTELVGHTHQVPWEVDHSHALTATARFALATPTLLARPAWESPLATPGGLLGWRPTRGALPLPTRLHFVTSVVLTI